MKNTLLGGVITPCYSPKLRYFEKVSFEQFHKDVGGDRRDAAVDYLDIKLPRRATKNSAGYDFYAPFDIYIEPNESVKFPTGIKVYMSNYEVLKLYVRSSLGFKHDVVLANGTGIIDSDYVDNKNNEGHIWIKLVNNGNKEVFIKKGDAFAQGILQTYHVTDDDKPISEERAGGIGSTDK